MKKRKVVKAWAVLCTHGSGYEYIPDTGIKIGSTLEGAFYAEGAFMIYRNKHMVEKRGEKVVPVEIKILKNK